MTASSESSITRSQQTRQAIHQSRGRYGTARWKGCSSEIPAFQDEAHRIDERNSGTQCGIHPRKAGQHHGITSVALRFVLVDCPETESLMDRPVASKKQGHLPAGLVDGSNGAGGSFRLLVKSTISRDKMVSNQLKILLN
jgi:hypothetical protein